MFKISHHTLEKIAPYASFNPFFHPSHLQPNMIDRSFWALVVLFSNKTNHYFSVPTTKNMVFITQRLNSNTL